MAEASRAKEQLEKVRTKATQLLAEKGLTVHDATDILLSKMAEDGAVPQMLLTAEDEYDAWFRAMVQEALDDPRPGIPGEEVEAEFAAKRAALRARIANGEK